jgi:hypothetical protein
MYVYNNEDNDFNIGDTVLITDTRLRSEKPYPAKVIEILENSKTEDCGRYYVLIVYTYIDDYIAVRKDDECFRDISQYLELAKRHAYWGKI